MDKNISIAFVIPSVEYGGAELQVINQINYLLKAKINIILIVLDDIKGLRDKIDLPADKVFELLFPIYPSYAKAIFKAPTLIENILGILKKQKVNTVVANLPFSHYIMRLVKMKANITNQRFRLINYHHSLQYTESPLDNFFKKAFNVFNSTLARFSDDKNIFISNASKIDVQEHLYVTNPVVIFNSVPFKKTDINFANEYLKANNLHLAEYNLILPGRLNMAKGHAFFIEVFNTFIEVNKLQSDQVKLILAGGGILQNEITSLIKAKGLEDFVHVTGFVSNDLLLSFLTLCNLVVIPSVFEGFGNVALEALMVNKLILASDAGGLKEIIQNGVNGFLFKTLDKQDCIGKLNFLYHKRDTSIINKETLAQDFAERFSFDAHIQKLVKEIKACAV
jgi:glycosyltransferase involved in cell wall biosynthesis